MKKRALFIFTIIILSACFTFTATAQDQARFGIGFGYSSGGQGTNFELEDVLSPASIYVPITFENFRLEPEIGYIRSSYSESNRESKLSVLQFGLGVFGLNSISDDNTIYYGGRFGITRDSESSSFEFDDESYSSTDYFFGPVFGSEYMLGDHFSLGGEAQLLYTSFDAEEDEDFSLIRTRATFFVRVHI